MAKAEKLVPFILKWEGGYSNHPSDKGGCTMKGVTIETYRNFYGFSKTCSDLKCITDGEWLEIFKTGYWDPMWGDTIENQSIANIIVDWAWGSGVRTATKKIQKLIGVKVDGVVGPITMASLNSKDQKKLFDEIYKERENFYYNICKNNPSQEVFLKGWLNRLADYKFEEEIPEEKKNN